MERIGAWLLLCATVIETIGLVWDVQWHTDVGPDTFFTAPHLVVYLGIAAAGLTSLAVVLSRTFRRRPDDGVRTVKVLGYFQSPVPFLVSGLGAAGTLLYGLADLWWHEVYGFDATPTSPPHVGMSLCGLITVTGGVMAFSALRESRPGRVGLALYVGVACYYNIFLMFSAPDLAGLATIPLTITLMCVLGLIITAAVTRSPGMVVLTGLSFAVLQAFSWFVTPWITKAYADTLGLRIRDYVDGTPVYAAASPLVMLPVAALVAAVLVVGKRVSSPKVAAPIVGGIAAGLMVVGHLLQFEVFSGATVTVAALLGICVGWIGWRVSAPLRTLVEV